MKKRVHEQVWPTLAVAAAGFALLAAELPEWARLEVLAFAAVFSVLVAVIDEDIRHALRGFLDSRLRRNDDSRGAKSARAKAPASRRAAT